MQRVKMLKLLFIFNLLWGVPALSCGIDNDIETLQSAQNDMDKEDALYGMTSSLNFCDLSAYAKAVKASYEFTDFGDYFLKSFLFQYKQYRSHSFAIGSSWDREDLELIVDKGLENYLFRVGSASGVFLGNYSGRALIATNRHVIEEEKCEGLIVEDVRGKSFTCSQIINPQSKLDYAFVLLSEDIDLTPIKFEAQRMESQTALLSAGRGYYHNEKQDFKEEKSELCQIFFDDELGQTMGCDSSPGDSGSPIFLRESGMLYGLANSTGNTMLSFSDSDYKSFLGDARFRGLLKLQSSHFVPLYRILADKVEQVGAKNILNCLNTKGCLK
ncbi:trypsin-like peptidase domain protein [Bacteriovorax sp. DB6_IX]|nr:trypsin-like peptidase domain protein [Bacteriovorax sp. DB6_IX]